MKKFICHYTLLCIFTMTCVLPGCYSRSRTPVLPNGGGFTEQDHILYPETLKAEQISIFIEIHNNIITINNQKLNPHSMKINRYFVKAGGKYQVRFKCEQGARVYGVTKCYQTINFVPAGGQSYSFNCTLEDGFIVPYAENKTTDEKTPMNWNIVPCGP